MGRMSLEKTRSVWQASLAVGLAIGVFAWASASRFALLDLRCTFSSTSRVAGDEVRDVRIEIRGAPPSEISLWPSCECARFEEKERDVRAEGVFIRGVFTVDPLRTVPDVRPGIWVGVRDVPFRLFRPEVR